MGLHTINLGKIDSQARMGKEGNSSRNRGKILHVDFGQQEGVLGVGKSTNHGKKTCWEKFYAKK